MLKGSSKKKRSRAEMEEVKHEEDLLNDNKQEFLRQFKYFNSNHNDIGIDVNKAKDHVGILNKLHHQGVIDAHGNAAPPKQK
jgi:hypothetical protein